MQTEYASGKFSNNIFLNYTAHYTDNTVCITRHETVQ